MVAKVDAHHCNTCQKGPMDILCFDKGHGFPCEECDWPCSAKHGCAVHKYVLGFNAIAKSFIKDGQIINVAAYRKSLLEAEKQRLAKVDAEKEAGRRKLEETEKLIRMSGEKRLWAPGFLRNGNIDWVQVWDEFPEEYERIGELPVGQQKTVVERLFVGKREALTTSNIARSEDGSSDSDGSRSVRGMSSPPSKKRRRGHHRGGSKAGSPTRSKRTRSSEVV